VAKANADSDNHQITTGYYRSTNNEFTQDAHGNKNVNTITITKTVPTNESGNVGDIIIVI
jgi:hypothetical protein